jgi:hypothetical protein
MRRSTLVFGLFATLASGCFYVEAPPPGPGPNSDGSLTIDNASSYVLTAIHVTAVSSSTWGSNLLGNDILYPDERLTVAVACNDYDVLIVDEYDRDCVLSNVDLCFTDQLWVIDNNTLRYCAF